jgi:hypothetical protein
MNDFFIQIIAIGESKMTPTILIESIDGLDQLYVNLERMEEMANVEDENPYENLADKQDKLDVSLARKKETKIQELAGEIIKAETIVDNAQMTMDLDEADNARSRLDALRTRLNKRQRLH